MIRVEFYDGPRLRAGTDAIDVPKDRPTEERGAQLGRLEGRGWREERRVRQPLDHVAHAHPRTHLVLHRPELADANIRAMRAGYNAGDIHELFQGRYEVPKCEVLPPGTYRSVMGNPDTVPVREASQSSSRRVCSD